MRDIFDNVCKALQPAEELGGVSGGDEYRQLMLRVVKECRRRLSACDDTFGPPSVDFFKVFEVAEQARMDGYVVVGEFDSDNCYEVLRQSPDGGYNAANMASVTFDHPDNDDGPATFLRQKVQLYEGECTAVDTNGNAHDFEFKKTHTLGLEDLL